MLARVECPPSTPTQCDKCDYKVGGRGFTQVPDNLFFKSRTQIRLCEKLIILRTTLTLFRF